MNEKVFKVLQKIAADDPQELALRWEKRPDIAAENTTLLNKITPSNSTDSVYYNRVSPYLSAVRDAATKARSHRIYNDFRSPFIRLADPQRYPYFMEGSRPNHTPQLSREFKKIPPFAAGPHSVLSSMFYDWTEDNSAGGETFLKPVLRKSDDHPLGFTVEYEGPQTISKQLVKQQLPHLSLIRKQQIDASRFKHPTAVKYFQDAAERKFKAVKNNRPIPVDIPLPDDVKKAYPTEEDQIGIMQDANEIATNKNYNRLTDKRLV